MHVIGTVFLPSSLWLPMYLEPHLGFYANACTLPSASMWGLLSFGYLVRKDQEASKALLTLDVGLGSEDVLL